MLQIEVTETLPVEELFAWLMDLHRETAAALLRAGADAPPAPVADVDDVAIHRRKERPGVARRPRHRPVRSQPVQRRSRGAAHAVERGRRHRSGRVSAMTERIDQALVITDSVETLRAAAARAGLKLVVTKRDGLPDLVRLGPFEVLIDPRAPSGKVFAMYRPLPPTQLPLAPRQFLHAALEPTANVVVQQNGCAPRRPRQTTADHAERRGLKPPGYLGSDSRPMVASESAGKSASTRSKTTRARSK